jgi:hypothetical protein
MFFRERDNMNVEKPASGRAVIREEASGVQIIIPQKWSAAKVFIGLFLLAWLGGWVFGETSAIGSLTGHITNSGSESFLLFWLIAWTIGGIAIICFLFWMLFRREIMTITSDILTIDDKVLGIGRTRRYSVLDIKNLRVVRQANSGYPYQTFSFATQFNQGVLAFDYGMRTIRFATGIDEAEGGYILDFIKKKYWVSKSI